MKIFSDRIQNEKKLDCIQRMLFNHIWDLNENSKKLNESFLQQFYRLLGFRKTLLTKILCELEHYDKVVIRFDFREKRDSRIIEFGVFHADELRWEELFKGLDGNQNGLCISFCFNDDKENSPWYYATESELRGAVLAKVFDVR